MINKLKPTQTITEYHPNGKLFYEMDYAFIEPMFVEMYKHTEVRRMLNGKTCEPYVILRKEKHFDNGQFAWRLQYDENGNLLNKGEKSYRKDGTIIVEY